MLLQDAGGQVAPQANRTMHHQITGRHLVEAIAQIVQRDQHRAGDRVRVVLRLGANVQHGRAGGHRSVHLVPLDRLGQPVAQVGRDMAEHVDGVFRRTELGRVGKLQVGQFAGQDAAGDRRGDDVYPLVDAGFADPLRTQDLVGLGIDQQLERELATARVIAGMVAGMGMDRG